MSKEFFRLVFYLVLDEFTNYLNHRFVNKKGFKHLARTPKFAHQSCIIIN